MLSGKDFFSKAFDEEYSDVEQVDIDTPTENEDVVETQVEQPTETVANAKLDVDTNKFNIDGEEVTLDQIKEWKQNGLRQSDYTRKTQELAEQRKLLGQVETPVDTIPTDSERLAKIERDLATKQLDLDITELKLKYPDFDEIKVLSEANKRGIYTDLEFVYKAIREVDNSSSTLNVEELKTQAIEDYKKQIALELKANTDATSDSIVSSVSAPATVDYSDELSSAEKEFAKKRGWTYKQYFDMKNEQYQ